MITMPVPVQEIMSVVIMQRLSIGEEITSANVTSLMKQVLTMWAEEAKSIAKIASEHNKAVLDDITANRRSRDELQVSDIWVPPTIPELSGRRAMEPCCYACAACGCPKCVRV